MKIERENNEIVFRISGDLDVDYLQDMADLLEYMEATKNSDVNQEDVDSLVKEIKKGRWNKTQSRLSE